jgi:hypothetical protein
MVQAKIAHWSFWEMCSQILGLPGFTPEGKEVSAAGQLMGVWNVQQFLKKVKGKSNATAFRSFFSDFGCQLNKYFSVIRYFVYNCEEKKGKRDNIT